ncbi:MAG: M20/M25/M40 family metallo-hydrolase [Chthoniobacterales bacterium]
MARPPFANIATVALWLGLILTGGLAIYGTRPPHAADASAPANMFSAARAMAHLEQIAKQTHPIGSDEAARVREYLIEQLRVLGAEVRIEQGVGTVQYHRNLHSGLVNNIVATFAGQSTSRAVMLVAHSDSVPEGPGAADDGAGLIVILETIRALCAGPPLKNDLIVLFTDGEEARGLLGAQAYAASHADLADRIGVIVNLEARGTSGPGLMFETSNNNGALIREFARSAPDPMATSLMAAIYKLLPNETDFTPLKAAGLTGLNFAFLETYEGYHTRLDTPANLDPRSVQHLGNNVLGVARHFGNLTLPLPTTRDLVYFNWFGSQLLVYPAWVAWVMAILGPILFGPLCLRSARPLRLTLGRVLAGFGGFFLQLLVITGGAFAAFAVTRFIAGEFLDGDTMSNKLLFTGTIGIAFGLGITSQRLLNKIGLVNLGAGQLFAVSFLTLVLCWFLVGGSYVLQWPLLFGMTGMFVALRLREPARSVCQFLFLVPALLILVPLAYMFFVSLFYSYLGLAAAAFLLTALLAMAPSFFDRLIGISKLSVTIVPLISACLIAAGLRLTVWSVEHPHPDSLIYSVNADEGKAKWVSYDAVQDAWTSRILGSNPRKKSEPAYTAGLERPVLSRDATVVSLLPPLVTITQGGVVQGEHTIKLQITSKRAARSFVVRLPGHVKVFTAGWNGNIQTIHENSPTNLPWTFRFYNAPPEGASLELRYSAQHPIRVWIADTSPSMPMIAPLTPRPDDTTPAYGSDVTLVMKALDL